MNYGIFLLKFFKLAIFLPKIYQICQFHIPAPPPCKKSYFFKNGFKRIELEAGMLEWMDIYANFKEIKFIKKILQFIKCGFRFQDVRGFS